ncbi:MAG: hypothetical protein ABSG75_09610 [Syntrophales bacterium]|jgi:hypothetical protein
MKRGFIVLSIIAVMYFASSYALAAASSGAQSCFAGQLRTADRCASRGSCKGANDPATCTVFTDLPCSCTSDSQCRSGHCKNNSCTVGN